MSNQVNIMKIHPLVFVQLHGFNKVVGILVMTLIATSRNNDGRYHKMKQLKKTKAISHY
jgi:hypothetical protein